MVTLTPRHGTLACHRHMHRSATHIYHPTRPPFTTMADSSRYVHPQDFTHCTRAWLLMCDECAAKHDPDSFAPLKMTRDTGEVEGWQELATVHGWRVMVPSGVDVATVPARATAPAKTIEMVHTGGME